MDGISGLYRAGQLFSRGDAITGRDLSHVLPLLKTVLPADAPWYVRGELIMNRGTFKDKFQGQPGRNNPRNSVSGALASIHGIDRDFLAEIEFIAYEIIPVDPTAAVMRPSEQFALLKAAGFSVAAGKPVDRIDDASLAAYYAELNQDYAYDIDGIVATRDATYTRHPDKNPPYARAFKQALECLLAPSRVTAVEWNPSSYGYLIPTVLYEPVQICGVTLSRATGESARYIIEHGLGPGAEVEVIYHGKVNPRIHQVFTPVEPDLPPEGVWEWVPRGDEEPPIHIRAVDGYNAETIQVKLLARFLAELGVKNVGEGLVKRLYEAGQTTIRHLLTMTPADIRFMGPKTSETIPAGIRAAVQAASIPTLMTSSGVFGRGFGDKKFQKLIQVYPDLLTWPAWPTEAIEKVDSFAGKTAKVLTARMPAFLAFLAENGIPVEPVDRVDPVLPSIVATPAASENNELSGKNVCLTGFRDAAIQTYLTRIGAKEQAACNKSTALLVIKPGYTNKKTEFAQANGIPVLTDVEFHLRFKL